MTGTLNEFENQNHLKLTKHHSTDLLRDSTLLDYLGYLGLSHKFSLIGLGILCFFGFKLSKYSFRFPKNTMPFIQIIVSHILW